MHVRNMTSRYHLVIAIFEKLASLNKIPKELAGDIVAKYQKKIADNTEFAKTHGSDTLELDAWTWKGEGNPNAAAEGIQSVIDA